MKTTTKRVSKIEDRCSVLEKMIVSIAPYYDELNEDQQRMLSTTIGAALFYIPHAEKMCYSGFVSTEVHTKLLSGEKVSLTKEHMIPRRVSALELIEKARTNSPLNLLEEYLSRYSRFNYVLPSENKRLIRFQKKENFTTPEEAYSAAGISLVPLSLDELRVLKRNCDINVKSPA